MSTDLHNIRLIVTDLDNTLLDSTKHIPSDFCDVFEALQDKGIKFFAASGRSYNTQYNLFGKNADDIGYICGNGAIIVEHGEISFISKLDTREGERLVEYAVNTCPGVCPVYCGTKGTYSWNSYKDDALMQSKIDLYYQSVTFIDSSDDIDDDIFKITLILPDHGHDILTPAMKKFESDLIYPLFSAPSCNDFMNKGIDKLSGIKKIQEKYNISPEETLVFLDYYNDLSMLDATPNSVAVENAPDEIKDMCAYVTDDCNHSGVTAFIKKYILG